MKHFAQILAFLLALAATAVASPLKKEQVAADAKWLVHLDVDKLRPTTVGGVIKQALDSKLGALKAQFDLDLDWNKISSLTAYGSAFEPKSNFNGVMLINTELDLQRALDGAIEKMSQGNSNPAPPIQKSQDGDVTTYSMKDHMFASFQSGKPVIIGRSRDSIQRAREVLSGTSPNLASTRTFSEFPRSRKDFFFLAAAEGLNLSDDLPEAAGEGNMGNPKAKILKLADGGRVMLGEEAQQLFADLSLKAKTSEVVTQMQQVIQGMIALASLIHSDNEDLQQLAQSAKVSAAGDIVNLQLGYPADKAVMMLNNHMKGNMNSNMNGHRERRKRARSRDGQGTKPNAESNESSQPDEK